MALPPRDKSLEEGHHRPTHFWGEAAMKTVITFIILVLLSACGEPTRQEYCEKVAKHIVQIHEQKLVDFINNSEGKKVVELGEDTEFKKNLWTMYINEHKEARFPAHYNAPWQFFVESCLTDEDYKTETMKCMLEADDPDEVAACAPKD